jgi:hypothetical protein
MAVTDTIKDAAYVTIGLGVLGVQKAQVRRVELTKQFEDQFKSLEAQITEGRKAVAGVAETIEGFVAPVRVQIESQLDAVEAMLPTPVSDVFKQARTFAHQTETTVRKTLASA